MFLNLVSNSNADDALVRYTGMKMRDKLNKKRMDGRYGWYTTQCSAKYLESALTKHIKKKDWLDASILAAMLFMKQAFVKRV